MFLVSSNFLLNYICSIEFVDVLKSQCTVQVKALSSAELHTHLNIHICNSSFSMKYLHKKY
jgi:hypothetical protein